ncbi:MAG: hypothetical protein H6R14_1706 [Proteobacteria bacterium]|nr:hypothetical protein [Pseudomonadota bacterium]
MTEAEKAGEQTIRILLEALTTISYLRGQDERAAGIAEFALDQYEKAMRHGGHVEGSTELQYLPGLCPEQRNLHALRRNYDRRSINYGPPIGQAEQRLGAERRINLDRRSEEQAYS